MTLSEKSKETHRTEGAKQQAQHKSSCGPDPGLAQIMGWLPGCLSRKFRRLPTSGVAQTGLGSGRSTRQLTDP